MKKCTHVDFEGRQSSVLVINDTGVGTNVVRHKSADQRWNIASFIEEQLNPERTFSYLIILSHCHYDHILGLNSLLPELHDELSKAKHPSTTPEAVVLSSSHARSFLEPYDVLVEHSLCASEDLIAPVYKTSIWAGDDEPLYYKCSHAPEVQLPIVTLHTPGHTPDSLSWYDTEESVIYVGDSFYAQESDDTRSAPWGPEGPAVILFPNEGDVVAWWHSLGKIIKFVEARNREGDKRVTLAAGHVTSSADADECLRNVKLFMTRVLRGAASFVELPRKRGERFGFWHDKEAHDRGYRFSLGAPLCVVEKGRQKLAAEL